MPDRLEKIGAIVLGACIGFGFAFGHAGGKLAGTALERLFWLAVLK